MTRHHFASAIIYVEQGDANQYVLLAADRKRWVLGLLHNGEMPVQEQRANLQRIVTCWNSHDALLAATESAYVKLADPRHQWPGRHTAEGQGLLNQLLNAIVLATGRDRQEAQDDYGSRAFITDHLGGAR
jgi:hypothetical protein